jgi:sarcosine oxidase subunit beta
MLPSVIIVGAGILGTSIAYHLRKLGEKRVVVIDRHGLSAGATGRSGALVRANYDNRADARLALTSLGFFRNWGDRVGGRCGFNPVGHMEIGYEASCGPLGELIKRQRRWGVDIGLIDEAEAKARVPSLRLEPPDASIAYHGGAGYCDPNLANRALYDAARAGGVEFIFGEAVTSVLVAAGRAAGVKTSRRVLGAQAVVLATGAWSNQLLKPLGLDFGLVTHLSRIVVFSADDTDGGETFPTIIDHVQQAWFRPMPQRGILVGAERGGRDNVHPSQVADTVPPPLVASYRRVLTRRFAVSVQATARRSWAGTYMMSPDRRPIVGSARQIPGLFLAVGDSGTSFKIAPAIGLGLAELIIHGAGRLVDLTQLAPDRFEAAVAGAA